MFPPLQCIFEEINIVCPEQFLTDWQSARQLPKLGHVLPSGSMYCLTDILGYFEGRSDGICGWFRPREGRKMEASKMIPSLGPEQLEGWSPQ